MKNIQFIALLLLLVTASCDEEVLEVSNYGSISGTVMDGESYLPVEGAMITTTPPSIVLLTNNEGKFSIPKVHEGEVAVSIKKKDYLSNSISVAIYQDQVTQLDFLIFKDERDVGNVTVYDPVPGNGAVDQPVSILLKWKVDSQKSSASFTFNIYFFESGSTVQRLVGEDISVPEVTVSGLNYLTTYFWYVVAKYEGNKVGYSPTWSFKTRASQ